MASCWPNVAVDEVPAAGSVWLFDVDGCLIDSLTGSSLRPLARELLGRLDAAGHTIVAWSAGGAAHAERVMTPHDVVELIDAFYDKDGRDGADRWRLDHLAAEHRPDVCVDDRPEDAPSGVTTIAVSPYLAPDLHDRGLQPALDAIGGAAPPPPELGGVRSSRVTLRP
jgi:hypothetical protein